MGAWKSNSSQDSAYQPQSNRRKGKRLWSLCSIQTHSYRTSHKTFLQGSTIFQELYSQDHILKHRYLGHSDNLNYTMITSNLLYPVKYKGIKNSLKPTFIETFCSKILYIYHLIHTFDIYVLNI